MILSLSVLLETFSWRCSCWGRWSHSWVHIKYGSYCKYCLRCSYSVASGSCSGVVSGIFWPGGQFGCLGATATPENKNPKHGKGKQNRVGKDVLFEFACAKDSNLGKVGPEHGVKVIRLCKEDIDLENLHYRAADRSGWCFGRVLHPLFRRMQAMVPMATFESGKVSKADNTNSSGTSRERSISCTIYSGGWRLPW